MPIRTKRNFNFIPILIFIFKHENKTISTLSMAEQLYASQQTINRQLISTSEKGLIERIVLFGHSYSYCLTTEGFELIKHLI